MCDLDDYGVPVILDAADTVTRRCEHVGNDGLTDSERKEWADRARARRPSREGLLELQALRARLQVAGTD